MFDWAEDPSVDLHAPGRLHGPLQETREWVEKDVMAPGVVEWKIIERRIQVH